ncbi:hypothetical protein [Mucilaginibacter ginsenosidivorax]|uniref:Uncharacterized protein n=1 Tax=Mucilaginibacter ginsenosidivorax TaxID=862126 RepID=A0A5B8W6U1_9SPHI|nr:hypothetical protein [Mucilaginibacter ginsenosidivorax]QEC79329.1 hypothetical protein FSB76_26520 [Mucilaginibacter ginsenosidivorax]
MTNFFDDFNYYGGYDGEEKEHLNKANAKRLIKEHGEEWTKGYLAALETAAIKIADILYPEKVAGIPQTPHMVRNNIKKYWSENKSVMLYLMSHIESSLDDKNKPQP